MDPIYNFYFTDNCAYSEANPKVFVEKNFSGSILLDNKEIRFPENIYSASNDTYIFKYEDTVFLSQEEAIVHYSLNEIDSYKDGISLYSATYTKSPSSQTEHEIRTPLNNTIPAYNKTHLVLPITDFDQSPFEVNYSSYQSIYNSLKSNLELIIDTSYDNGSSVTYSSFPFSSSNFTQHSIEILPGKYKVTFRFQDDNPSVNPSGLLVIEVNKTPVITGNITQIADLNINTLSCCKDNPTLQSFLSESSSSSSSSNSSSSSSSNSSSSNSSSSSISSTSSSSSSSRDSWPPICDQWTYMNSFGSGGQYYENASNLVIGSPDNTDIFFTTNKALTVNTWAGYVNKYNIITNQISNIATIPSDINIYSSSVRFSVYCNNKMYCFLTSTHNTGLPNISRLWEYNILTDSWTQLANPPLIGLMYRPKFIVLPENKIMMIGGVSISYSDGSNIFHRYNYVFDTNTNTWTRKADRPFFAYSTMGKYCQYDNLVWTYSYNGEGYPFDRIDAYNYSSDTWNLLQPNADSMDSIVDYYGDLYFMHSSGGFSRQWGLLNKSTYARITKQICPINASLDQVTCGQHIYAFGANQIWRYGC
jgi:hypothetical protein